MDEKSKVVTVGVFQVDLAKLTPLTLGDQEALAKEPYKVDFRSPAKSAADDLNLVWFILRKVEPQVTRDAAATLSVRASAAIVAHFSRLSAEVDDFPLALLPPSSPSTPSRTTTDGPQP